MKQIVIGFGISLILTMSANAQGRPNACVDVYRFTWGFDTSATGRVKPNGSCRTSFSYGQAKTTGFRVVQNAANGNVQVGQAGDGRASIVYTPRKGFTGSDAFIVEIKGKTINRIGGENPETATKITYNFTVSP